MDFHNNGGNGSPSINADIESWFHSFYEGWLVRLEQYLDELLSAQNSPREEELRQVVSRVLSHYQHYFEEKIRAANTGVFLAFSPTWFTPFECTFHWMAGFKPGILIRLVENSVKDLSLEQVQQLDMLRVETKTQEKQLSDKLARVQESVATPPFLQLIERGRRPVDGEWSQAEQMLETLSSSMKILVENADLLRLATARKATELLNPLQTVRFLAAAAKFQLTVRTVGREKEAKRLGRIH